MRHVSTTLTAAFLFASCTDKPETATKAPSDAVPGFYVVERLTHTLNDVPHDVLPGFGFEITRVEKLNGLHVGVSRLGQAISLSDLRHIQPSSFSGVRDPDPRLRLAFVVNDLAPIRAAPVSDSALVTRAPRLSVLDLRSHDGPVGFYNTTQGWIAAKDVRVPHVSGRPAQVSSGDVWIDIDLTTQTLVAYAGERPVLATLISAGVGAPGTVFATPHGLHRIVAKLRWATMDNLEHSNVVPYHYETVPYTQYIGRVALHGVFWHNDFGKPKSHGCINLSLADAAALFELTQPTISNAANEARSASGTIVRVR